MVVVFAVDRLRLQHLEPLDAGTVHQLLAKAGVEPSSDWGGVIADDEKVILVYYHPPVPVGKIADALGVDANYLVKVREFEYKGKGRYLLHEGLNRKGRFERVEIVRE
jgi:hypothetical protein